MAKVYVNASASLSALGEEITDISDFTKAQQLNRLSAPLSCFYQAIPLAPLNESEQRIYQLLTHVIDKIIAKLALDAEQLANTCLFLGSSSLDIGCIESDASKAIWLNPLEHINQHLRAKYAFAQLHYTFNTACTSSANALLYANRLIKADKIKQALVIGCEFYNQLTLKGFDSLELLSKQGLFAFSPSRDGMVLGEGVGAILLSKAKKINTTKANLALLEGYSSCDTYSLTTTQEDGDKIAQVIEQAVALADVKLSDIDLIKAHGTASPVSDQAEAQALNSLFQNRINTLALKPYVGHTLGACGALELAILNQLIDLDMMPQAHYQNTELNPLVPLANSEQSFTDIRYILLNHCGFGGNNAALVVEHLNAATSESSDCESTDCRSTENTRVNKQGSTKNSASILASTCVSYASDETNKAIRKQVKAITGFEVRRMDSFTLIALQAVAQLFASEAVKVYFASNSNSNGKQVKPLAQAQLGLYGVADYLSVELLQSLVETVEQGHDVRPFDFISTVGNAANFYIAKQFNVEGVNLFNGASEQALDRTRLLIEQDLNLNLIDYALLVHWQQQAEQFTCHAYLIASQV